MNDKPINGPSPADFFNWMSQFAQPMMEAGAKIMGQVPTATPQTDPFTAWKNMTQGNEKMWTEFMSQLITTPEFAAGLGRTASSQAAMRDAIRRTAQSYLEAANMPSREDVTRLATQIVTLDAKVDDLVDRLDENLQTTLDKFLARLDRLDQQAELTARLVELETRQGKLAQLEQQLTAIEAKLDQLAQPQPKSVEPAQAKATPTATKPKPAQATKPKLAQPAKPKAARPTKAKAVEATPEDKKE